MVRDAKVTGVMVSLTDPQAITKISSTKETVSISVEEAKIITEYVLALEKRLSAYEAMIIESKST